MNKSMIFLAGVATGALASFLLFKDKLKQDMEDELDAMNDYYETRYDELQRMYNDELASLPDYEGVVTEAEKEAEMKKTYVDYVKKFSPNEMVEDHLRDLPYPIEEEDERLLGPEDDPPEDEYADYEPELITQHEFDHTFPHYLKEDLFYYEIDDILVTDDDTIVTDEFGTVGEALVNFQPDNLAFVRNHKWSTDYMVTRLLNQHYQAIPPGYRD